MPVTAKELFELARKVEVTIAALYEDMVGHLTPGSEEARFFAKMAAQEHMHAGWVDEMAAEVDPAFVFPDLEGVEFATILTTIADVHDEVVSEAIGLP